MSMPPWYMISPPVPLYESSVFFAKALHSHWRGLWSLGGLTKVIWGHGSSGDLPQIQLKTSMVHQCSSSSMRNVGNHQGSRAWYCCWRMKLWLRVVPQWISSETNMVMGIRCGCFHMSDVLETTSINRRTVDSTLGCRNMPRCGMSLVARIYRM